MINTLPRLALAILALGLTHQPLRADEKVKENPHADPEHARLTAARKAAHEIAEVMSADQQAKADRAVTHKALADYKAARKRSTASEETYRKAYDAGLTKVDEGAVAIQERERVAFRERMQKARKSKPKSGKDAVAKADDNDDNGEDDEPSDKHAN